MVFTVGAISFALRTILKRLNDMESLLQKGKSSLSNNNIGYYYQYLMDFKASPFSFSANKALLLCLENDNLDEISKRNLMLANVELFHGRDFTVINSNELYYNDSKKGGSTIHLDENGFVTYLEVNLNGVFMQDSNKIDMRSLNVQVTFSGKEGDIVQVYVRIPQYYL